MQVGTAYRRVVDTAMRVVTPLHIVVMVCAVTLSACTTFQPIHRKEITFPIKGSHDQFMAAAKVASERLGGTIIERPIFTPRSAELVDSSRRDQSSIYVGFMTPTSGLILDSLWLKSVGPDSGIVVIRSFYPVIAGSAITEEMEYPHVVGSIAERRAERPAMPTKSRLLYDGLSLVSPALANTYLLIGNPFAGASPEVVSILIPLAIDAGLAFFAFSEQGNSSKPGTAALGLAAVYMRLSGVFGLSTEIDRYNTVARSGYNLDLDGLQFFKTQITMTVNIP